MITETEIVKRIRPPTDLLHRPCIRRTNTRDKHTPLAVANPYRTGTARIGPLDWAFSERRFSTQKGLSSYNVVRAFVLVWLAVLKTYY